MAFQTIWYFTDIPSDIVDSIEKDLSVNYEQNMEQSRLVGNGIDLGKRNSQNTWVPAHHWISGFCWHYVNKANQENFLYDVSNIDCNSIQFTKYEEGQHYGWHNDAGILALSKPSFDGKNNSLIATDFLNQKAELIRKLSFVLQLSDPEDYDGGNLQLLNEEGNSYFAPRKKGTMIVFDSRTQHRVLKVKRGVRKSLVGWVVGPRWK